MSAGRWLQANSDMLLDIVRSPGVVQASRAGQMAKMLRNMRGLTSSGTRWVGELGGCEIRKRGKATILPTIRGVV